MQIDLLREATREDHAAVEGAISLMSHDLSLAEYVSTIERMYGFVCRWELQAEVQVPLHLKSILLERSRRRFLLADLEALHGVPGAMVDVLPGFSSAAELLGSFYVMEGSRLGGQLIARHVESVLDLKPTHGTRYFHGFGNRTGAMWKELIQILEQQICAADADLAIRSAKQTFRSFGEWMRGAGVGSATASFGEAQHG